MKLSTGARRCASLGRVKPVARVERAAHAQREGRDIDQYVGRHFLAVVDELLFRRICPRHCVCLIRPFRLAVLRGTGYRKE